MELDWEISITKCTDHSYLVQHLQQLDDGGLRREMYTFQDFVEAMRFAAHHFAEEDLQVRRGKIAR